MASAGMAERDRRAVDQQLAAARSLGAGQDVEQLVLALALERDDAEHLARVQVERDVLELRARRPRPRAADARRRVGRPGRARRRARRPPACSLDDLAEHQLDDPLLGALGDVDDADRLALAQDGGPVADGGDLDHPVRDEDDRPVAAALAADDLEDPLGEVGRQRGGHLVEHQHVRLDRERAGEVDDPQRGQRHAAAPGSTGRGRRGRARRASGGTARSGVSVRRRLERMSRSGMRAGSW